MLVVCAASGLAIGGLARGIGSTANRGSQSGTATHTTAASSTSGATATATNSDIPTALPASPFTLTLTVSPHVAAPGASLTVTVSARSDAGNAPLAGLSCTLRAPRDGAQPLLQQWPPAAVTGGDGTATWQLAAPSSPGQYELEVYAQGQHGLYYLYDASVTVTR